MTKVTLHKVRHKKRPCFQVEGEKTKYRHIYMLRWYSTNGRHHAVTVGDCKRITKREAERARRDKQSKLDCNVESPDKPTKMTLKDFRPYYIERRRQGESDSRPMCLSDQFFALPSDFRAISFEPIALRRHHRQFSRVRVRPRPNKLICARQFAHHFVRQEP